MVVVGGCQIAKTIFENKNQVVALMPTIMKEEGKNIYISTYRI